MADTKEAVTDTSGKAAEAGKVDERGVAWENRAKEFERKYTELSERSKQLEERLQAAETRKVEAPDPSAAADEKKRKLMEFVEDPDGYVERRLAEREFKKQQGEVRPWLEKQDGYKPDEDKSRLIEIEREYGLTGAPLQVAKAAWNIRQKEKLEREFSEFKKNGARDTSIRQSMTEGSGKSISHTNTPKRAELLAELKSAAAKNDNRRQAEIISLLEDVRE